MALITCKECKKKISTKAKMCPNCGAPTCVTEAQEQPVHTGKARPRRKLSRKQCFAIGVAVLGLVGLHLATRFPLSFALLSLAAIGCCIAYFTQTLFRSRVLRLLKLDATRKTRNSISIAGVGCYAVLCAVVAITTLAANAAEAKRLAQEAKAKRKAEAQAEYLTQRAAKRCDQLFESSKWSIARGDTKRAKGLLDTAVSLEHAPDIGEVRRLREGLEAATDPGALTQKLASLSEEEFKRVLEGESVPKSLLPRDPCLHDICIEGFKTNLDAAVALREQMRLARERKRQAEEESKKRAEAERLARIEKERREKARKEAERRKVAEAARRKVAEAERRKVAEAERRKKETLAMLKSGRIWAYTVGKVKWKIHDAYLTHALPKGFSGKPVSARGQFLVVKVEVENLAKSMKTITGLSVIDGQGRRYVSSTSGFFDDQLFLLENLNPNVPVTFSDVYEIPANASNLQLQLGDLSFWTTTQKLVDLSPYIRFHENKGRRR